MVNTREAAGKTPLLEERVRSLEQIRLHEAQFRKACDEDVNIVPKLISTIFPVNTLTSKAIHAVRRCLVLAESSESSSDERIHWMKLQRDRYVTALVSIIKGKEGKDVMNASIAAASLTHQEVWKSVCQAVMTGENKDLQELLFTNFVFRFSDLRLGVLQLIEDQIGTVEMRLRGLSSCRDAEGEVAKTEVTQKELKSTYVRAWLSVLRSEMDVVLKRMALERVPKDLIPFMLDPMELSDFLISCFGAEDIAVAIAALDGLFILISRHRLEYPLFYQKVYSLLQVDVFGRIENPTRFMELVATFLLKGTMIPGNMVAAFVKRLVRRALTWSSHYAIWGLRLALGILQKHPGTSFLVHRSVNMFDKTPDEQKNGEDPFDDAEFDPQASGANESSLWELQVLKKHINPAVSRLAMAFERDVRNRRAPPPGELSDYTGLEFSDVFQAEVHRKAKTSPLAYSSPGSDPAVTRLRKRLRSCVSWT
ncbi:Nucleolar complex protein [Gracilaria domingensis]|nr:Nucleolar complex protein [Gracilaria domingensis]